ncbi:MAG: hypothetical protein HOP96_04810 [Sphingomonas sp.]|nr:hypothetical protein [Sphingomonas sp.]
MGDSFARKARRPSIRAFRRPMEAIVLKRVMIVALLLTGTAAGARAQSAPQATVRADLVKTVDGNFDKGDVNNDGFLSRNEIANMTGKAAQQLISRMEQEFTQMDKDKNGQVSLAEFKSAATAKLAGNSEATLQRLDSNHDGKVSPNEFRAPALTAFDRVDANKDGKVTPEEAKKASGR